MKQLGVGVGFRPEYFSQYESRLPLGVQWSEAITENFMPFSDGTWPRSIRTLEHLRTLGPVVLHGVSLSVGSDEGPDPSYLKRLKELAQRIQPEWVSDHLCFVGDSRARLHDLLPLSYTQESLDQLVRSVHQVQESLDRKLVLENVSAYFEYKNPQMSEWEFLSQLCKRSGCGLLLDINNVYVSSVNQGFQFLDYVQGIPFESVVQFHLAGHTTHEDGFLIDTHDQPVCEAVWKGYSQVIAADPRARALPVLLERDGNFPEWSEIAVELSRIEEIRGQG